MSAHMMVVPRLSGDFRLSQALRRSLPPLCPSRCTKESHAELRADYARYIAETDLVEGGPQDLGDGTECDLRNCRRCNSSLMHDKDVRPTAKALEERRRWAELWGTSK